MIPAKTANKKTTKKPLPKKGTHKKIKEEQRASTSKGGAKPKAKASSAPKKFEPPAGQSLIPTVVMAKLGSIVVHADELLSPGGHSADLIALLAALSSPELKTWLQANSVMLPLKRDPMNSATSDSAHRALAAVFARDGSMPAKAGTDQDEDEEPWTTAYKDVKIAATVDLGREDPEDDDEDDDKGDPYTFVLHYTPTSATGKPQSVTLDANQFDDAIFEAANILGHGCAPEDLKDKVEYD